MRILDLGNRLLAREYMYWAGSTAEFYGCWRRVDVGTAMLDMPSTKSRRGITALFFYVSGISGCSFAASR